MKLKPGKTSKVASESDSKLMRSYKKPGKLSTSMPKLGKAGKAKDGGAFATVKKKDGNRPVKLY